MSQKFANTMGSPESLYQDYNSRRQAQRVKLMRDPSNKGIRATFRDHGSKGDSVRKEAHADINSCEFPIRSTSRPDQTHCAHLSTDRERGETWSRILRQQSSNENISGFSKFDPLRTIHFLGKELQSQLQDCIPLDSTVFDVISEMQCALKRIPHDIQVVADTAIRKHENIKPHKAQHKTEKIKTKTEACQTPNMWYLEPVRLQQHLEESSEKIEKACQQMEVLCSKLKAEKENIEMQLQIEKEASNVLRHQLEEYQSKIQSSTVQIELLKSQNHDLKVEVEKQKVQLAGSDTPSAAELKLFIQDLERSKAAATSENERLRQQVQLAQIETEKYEAVLHARDMQVKEIRKEMTQLQEVVNEQLLDFQNLSTSDEMTSSKTNRSHSTHTSSTHAQETDANRSLRALELQIIDPNYATSSSNVESVHELFNNRFNQYDDAHSPAGSTGPTDEHLLAEMHGANATNNLKLRHVFKVPIDDMLEVHKPREMFHEEKSQTRQGMN